MPYRFSAEGAVLFRARVMFALDMWPERARVAAQQAAEDVAQRLADAAPRGKESGASKPIKDDEPGPLFTSFVPVPGTVEEEISASVETTQPNKLRAVTEGTGVFGRFGTPIVPVVKEALYWQGAPHPFASVAGQPANNFVDPVLDDVDQIVIDRIGAAAEVVIDTMERG